MVPESWGRNEERERERDEEMLVSRVIKQYCCHVLSVGTDSVIYDTYHQFDGNFV